jgi:hypothetical protein
MAMTFIRRLLPLAGIFVLLVPPIPAHADAIVRNPGEPSYVVSLRSGGLGHDWRGTERVSFTNLEADPLPTIWLRLWSNGVLGCGFHAIEVSHVAGGSARALSRNCTALPVDLDAPLAPGGRTTISMHVAIHLPARNDRFGYYRGLALLGTALPTLAVNDDFGWHLAPFVGLGESFYSIVGNYQVTLDVPQGLATPTTGVAMSSMQTPGPRRVTTYVAHSVRDFEWAAGHLATVRGRAGATDIAVSYLPTNVTPTAARRALGYAVRSMKTFARGFGAFPYPEMDVVLTGFTAFGGMEYPTIIFTNREKLTIAHELGHQYFYGIVGDDQFSAPWLDESFATWVEHLPFGGWKRCDHYRWPSDASRITNDMAYWNAHPFEYDTIYSGGGCMLANLAERFGLERFVGVLHDYVQAHWLGVTRTPEFKIAIEDAAVADGLAFDPAAYWAFWRLD